MHKDFADWYRQIDVQPDDGLLQRRWKAIDAHASSAPTTPYALDLVRVFFGLATKDSGFLEAYRTPFKSVDAAFPMKGNDAEVRVLAGATIAALLEKQRPPLTDTTALASVCADCRGLRRLDRLREVITLAREHMTARSSSLRLVSPAQVTPLATLAENLSKKLDEAASGNSATTLATALKQPLDELFRFAEEATRTLLALTRLQELRFEENEILWWAFGEYSRETNKPLTSFKLPGACILVGKELADLTSVIPGPASVVAIIDRVLHVVEPELRASVALSEAITDVPNDLKASWSRRGDIAHIDDICPTLFALSRAVESSGKGWIPAVERHCGVKGSTRFTPLQLAWQVYEENLLLKSLTSDK